VFSVWLVARGENDVQAAAWRSERLSYLALDLIYVNNDVEVGA
jgi:hypothetical protein